MGKMKELYMEEQQRQENITPDDIDWNYHQIKPIATQADGKACWKVKSIKDDCVYKIWAYSYDEAVTLLPMIESF